MCVTQHLLRYTVPVQEQKHSESQGQGSKYRVTSHGQLVSCLKPWGVFDQNT